MLKKVHFRGALRSFISERTFKQEICGVRSPAIRRRVIFVIIGFGRACVCTELDVEIGSLEVSLTQIGTVHRYDHTPECYAARLTWHQCRYHQER